MWAHSSKEASASQGGRTQKKLTCWHVDLGLPEVWGHKCVLLRPLSLWDLAVAAWYTNTDSASKPVAKQCGVGGRQSAAAPESLSCRSLTVWAAHWTKCESNVKDMCISYNTAAKENYSVPPVPKWENRLDPMMEEKLSWLNLLSPGLCTQHFMVNLKNFQQQFFLPAILVLWTTLELSLYFT